MFDLGTQELIVIFIVVLLVFGPKRLPELARTLGKGVNELKSALRGVRESIEEAEVAEEIKKARESVEKELIKSAQLNIDAEEHRVEEGGERKDKPSEMTPEEKREDG